MNTLASLLVAFAVTVVAILALLPWASRIGLVQHPSGHRGHVRPTPLLGGLGVFAGLLAGWAVDPGLARMLSLVLAASIVVVIGVLDDRFQLPHWSRFPAQVLAGWVLVSLGGVALHDLGSLVTETHAYVGAWSVPLTIFAVVGVVNATNMSDGMDGLAGSLALVTSAGLMWALVNASAAQDIAVLAVFMASVAGFLVFNLRVGARKHARVFLGDAGSSLSGVVLAYFLIKTSQGQGAPLRPVTVLWLFALPLFDAVGVMLRRVGNNNSPFKADERHYHHYLRAVGMSVNGSLAVSVAVSAACAIGGIAAQNAGVPERWMFGGFLALFAVYVFVMEYTEIRLKKTKEAQ